MAVYDPNNIDLGPAFWEEIKHINICRWNFFWILEGDFNVVMQRERVGIVMTVIETCLTGSFITFDR